MPVPLLMGPTRTTPILITEAPVTGLLTILIRARIPAVRLPTDLMDRRPPNSLTIHTPERQPAEHLFPRPMAREVRPRPTIPIRALLRLHARVRARTDRPALLFTITDMEPRRLPRIRPTIMVRRPPRHKIPMEPKP
jgi:hypothetical protein